MDSPLQGVKVLDLGLVGVGPWAASLLGALGADVIKIERPAGDPIHGQPPLQGGLMITYTFLNCYKRSAVLDLRKDADRGVFERLVRDADVVMENQRPGRLAALGFGFPALAKLNPRIVYACSPGWGDEGPMRDLASVDTHFQGFSGFWQSTGPLGGPPENARYPVLDFFASCFLTASVLLGLIARERTGRGLQISSSHVGSAINAQITRLAEFFAGREPRPSGSASTVAAPDQAFLCQDGKYLAVSAVTEEQWRKLCAVLGLERLAGEPRFAGVRARLERREELAGALAPAFMTRPSRWWVVRLLEAGVPHALFADSQAVMESVQAWDNGYIQKFDTHHQGWLYYTPPPWRFSESSLPAPRGPRPGEHTEEVLAHGFQAPTAAAVPAPVVGAPLAAPAPRLPPLNEGDPPLAGVKAVELAEGLCGPFLGYLLAQSGAEVIKVEPRDGDPARRWGPEGPGGDSAAFLAINANKKSVALDLGHRRALDALRPLIDGSDIVVESLPWSAPAGVPGYRRAAGKRPDLIWCAISPYGRGGPKSQCPPSELAIQAAASWCSSAGRIGEPPVRIGADVASLGTALLGFVGLLGGFWQRMHTGRGQRLETSMFGGALCLRGALLAAISQPDEWRGTYCESETRAPHYAYKTKDRPIYFTFHETTAEQYVSLLTELGLQDMLADPRFGNNGRDTTGNNGRYVMELWPIWERAFAVRGADELVEMINRRGGAAVVANEYRDLVKHPQVQTLHVLQDVPLHGARWSIVRAPWRGPWTHPAFAAPPALGEHTEDVLRRAGLAPDVVADLFRRGLVGAPQATRG